MNKLVISNLIHRPLRTFISIFAIGIEVVMILCIVALMYGQLNGQKTRISGVGADMTVRPANASFMTGVSGAPVSAKVADILRRLPHIAVVAPVIQNFATSGTLEVIWGIDYESYNALKPFDFVAGGPFTNDDDVIIDDYFAASDKGHKVGDTISVLNQPFHICGIVEHGKGGRKFLTIRKLGQLIGSEGHASLFYIRSDDPKNEDLIKQEIKNVPGMSEYQVQTMDEWLSQMTPAHIPVFTKALNTVIAIAVIIGFLVIFQSMYTAVLERTREIGILKSLGAGKGYIVGIVLRETAFISIAGVIVGIVITLIIKSYMAYHDPTMGFEVTSEWLVRGSIIAFVGALLGAVYPALKAASKDPIDALAYD
jgi:putative ABC transport system permease protein